MKKVAGTKVRCDHLPLAKEPPEGSIFDFMMLEMYFPGAGNKDLPKFPTKDGALDAAAIAPLPTRKSIDPADPSAS